ncbi:dynein light chain LC6, flagellar outer arm isoform X1 [Canna indica]|uniref:Dynein light chain n=1 Tax=Canna indica TaxID=4628 RepID=A0AAQ3JST4_9LILI|nr:dynein light chain LC6, flagellar outer arm isoform X1 [Canna indica]
MREAKPQQTATMEGASAELESRSQYLSSLIQRAKVKAGEDDRQKAKQQEEQEKGPGGRNRRDNGSEETHGVRVRASDMPLALQKRAFQCAREALASMPKLDNKQLALALKKEFDSSFGPAWHCIVGRSFGSYVTHTLGGFLYFSIDKIYILLFRTAVKPLGH